MTAGTHEFETLADRAVSEVVTLHDAYAEAIGARMDLEAARPIEKSEAVLRIMDARQLAATPAEKLVESDDRYASFLREHRTAVASEMKAKGRAEASVLRAELAIARVESRPHVAAMEGGCTCLEAAHTYGFPQEPCAACRADMATSLQKGSR